MLQYGVHLDQPDDYKGPLYLPGEVHPDGMTWLIDDLPPELLAMIPNDVRSHLSSDTKEDLGSWMPKVLRGYSSYLKDNAVRLQSDPFVVRVDGDKPSKGDVRCLTPQYRGQLRAFY